MGLDGDWPASKEELREAQRWRNSFISQPKEDLNAMPPDQLLARLNAALGNDLKGKGYRF